MAEHGDSAPIRWLGRDERYGEKLATPDITIADLIGEVDPIKVAEGRYLADEHTLHYGLVPRTNRGIFAINELPDLAERIQVGLLNLLEERDVQIRGHRVRLPLDVFIVATANPEDYTNRGRIITPLKDRYGAQIRTHYPASVEQEIEIMAQEARVPTVADGLDETAGLPLHVASFMHEIIAEITHAARRSPDVNQRSGVSVRASIANYETLTANAVRRALTLDEPEAAPRISDLAYILPSFQGKLEVEAMEEGDEARVIARIVQTAVKAVFGRAFDGTDFEAVEDAFDEGFSFTVGARRASSGLSPHPRGHSGPRRALGGRKPRRPRRHHRIHPGRAASEQAVEQAHRSGRRGLLGLKGAGSTVRQFPGNLRYSAWDGSQQLALDAGEICRR